MRTHQPCPYLVQLRFLIPIPERPDPPSMCPMQSQYKQGLNERRLLTSQSSEGKVEWIIRVFPWVCLTIKI